MRVDKGHIEGLRGALAASVVALVAAGPALTAAAQPAASRYAPTMADYLGVYDALQNYRWGVDKHDQKAAERAFWEDGANTAVLTPGGPEINIPLKNGRAPQGRTGQPEPSAWPPPGASAGPPSAGGDWHLPLDSYIHFESPTRATHYEYFLSIYPQPEKKRAEGSTEYAQNGTVYGRVSIAGWPGHYEDILEKRNGEWRILKRKTMFNQ